MEFQKTDKRRRVKADHSVVTVIEGIFNSIKNRVPASKISAERPDPVRKAFTEIEVFLHAPSLSVMRYSIRGGWREHAVHSEKRSDPPNLSIIICVVAEDACKHIVEVDLVVLFKEGCQIEEEFPLENRVVWLIYEIWRADAGDDIVGQHPLTSARIGIAVVFRVIEGLDADVRVLFIKGDDR